MASSIVKSCCICVSEYNESVKKPLILQCGHTICKSCLQDVALATETEQECPICRYNWSDKTINDLPLCYQLLPDEGWSCQTHNSRISFWCRSCDEKLCRKCLTLNHKNCDWTLMEDKVELVKQKFDNKFTSSYTLLNKNIAKIEKITKENKQILDAAKCLQKGIAKVELDFCVYQQQILLLRSKIQRAKPALEQIQKDPKVQSDHDILSTYEKKEQEMEKLIKFINWPDKPDFKFVEKLVENFQVDFIITMHLKFLYIYT